MKKVKVAITLDSQTLNRVDGLVRKRQTLELGRGQLISNRSNVIEEMVKDYLAKSDDVLD